MSALLVEVQESTRVEPQLHQDERWLSGLMEFAQRRDDRAHGLPMIGFLLGTVLAAVLWTACIGAWLFLRP